MKYVITLKREANTNGIRFTLKHENYFRPFTTFHINAKSKLILTYFCALI